MRTYRGRLIFGLLLVVVSTMTFLSLPAHADPMPIVLKQGGLEQVVTPIVGTTDVVSFFNYYSASAHTPYMEDQASKLYFYEDPAGNLSLVMHHSIDNSVSRYMRVDFDFEGIPDGAYVSVSDDPWHAWDAPRGQEFSLDYDMEGHWEHYRNSDGGVLSGLPTDEAWCMTIDPYFIAGINSWDFLTPSGAISLDMDTQVELCQVPVPGAVLLGMIGLSVAGLKLRKSA